MIKWIKDRFSKLTIELSVLFGACLILVIHILYCAYRPYIDHDVAQYLTMGQMLLKGAVPYVDVVDTNPPMVIYFSTIPVILSALSGIRLVVCAQLFFLTVVVASAILFVIVLKAVRRDMPRTQGYAVFAIWIWMSLWTYRSGHFAQREQFVFLFLSPFVVLRLGRHAGLCPKMWLSITISVLVAMGIAMKPFYLLAVVAVEMFYFVLYRRFRSVVWVPESAVLLAAGVLYAGHFLILPGMSSFYTYWIPLVSRAYGVYGTSVRDLVRWTFLYMPYRHCWMFLPIVLCTAVFFRKALRLPAAFGILAVSSLCIFFWQAKAWVYQRLPFHYSLLAGTGLLLLELLPKKDNRRRLHNCVIAVALAVMIGTVGLPNLLALVRSIGNTNAFAFPRYGYTEVIDRLTMRDERVLFVSTSVGPASPALAYTGRLHGGRYLAAFPLAFYLHDSSGYETLYEWRDDEARFLGDLASDVRTYRPRLVFIKYVRRNQALPPHLTIAGYLRHKGFQQRSLRDYRYLGQLSECDVYLLIRNSEKMPGTPAARSLNENLTVLRERWGLVMPAEATGDAVQPTE